MQSLLSKLRFVRSLDTAVARASLCVLSTPPLILSQTADAVGRSEAKQSLPAGQA